jgi:heme/copper-type cytochrome/quinol oxidase subunit 2
MGEVERVEEAERLGRSRSRVFFMMAIVFFGQQGAYLAKPSAAGSAFQIGAWLVLVMLVLLLIATGGFLLKGRKVWDLLNDETSRINRSASQALGFWATIFTALLVYVESLFEPVSLNEALHIIITIGVGAALVSFAVRERKAHRIG